MSQLAGWCGTCRVCWGAETLCCWPLCGHTASAGEDSKSKKSKGKDADEDEDDDWDLFEKVCPAV